MRESIRGLMITGVGLSMVTGIAGAVLAHSEGIWVRCEPDEEDCSRTGIKVDTDLASKKLKALRQRLMTDDEKHEAGAEEPAEPVVYADPQLVRQAVEQVKQSGTTRCPDDPRFQYVLEEMPDPQDPEKKIPNIASRLCLDMRSLHVRDYESSTTVAQVAVGLVTDPAYGKALNLADTLKEGTPEEECKEISKRLGKGGYMEWLLQQTGRYPTEHTVGIEFITENGLPVICGIATPPTTASNSINSVPA